MANRDMHAIRGLTHDQYRGFCLARRHGARRALKAIRDNKCYRKIFTAAIRDIGKQRLIDIIISNSDRIWLAFEFLRTCPRRLSQKDKKTLVVAIVKHGDSGDARRCLDYMHLDPSLRRLLIEKIAESLGSRAALLYDSFYPDRSTRPPLPEEELTLLG